MLDSNCLFCKIIKGEIPCQKVHETEHFIAFLDIKPINLGHTLIVPKDHQTDIFDLGEPFLSALGGEIKDIARAVKAGTGADGINVGMNNGRAAGQLVPHAHIHIMPRFDNDSYKSWVGQDVTAEELEEIGEKIKSVIKN